MSAAWRSQACPWHPTDVRYRNQRQARAGRDRTRARQLAAGVPAALCLASWFRCDGCRGWHLRVDADARRAFMGELHVTGARALRLLDAA